MHLRDGSKILEKNNYWCSKTKKRYATNWWEVPKSKIAALELFYKGSSVLRLEKDGIKPEEWVFSHTGAIDLRGGAETTVTLSRNIGFIEDGLMRMYRVSEATGQLSFDEKKA